EWSRSVAVQRSPCLFIDFRFESRLQCFVRIVRAKEIGLAHKKALFVVVAVHQPARNSFGSVAANRARRGVKHIDTDDLHLNLTVLRLQDLYVWFTENDEQVSFARVLQFVGHVQIGIHACLQNWYLPQFVEIRRVSVIVKRAGDKHIEARIARFPSGSNEVWTRNRTELRTNEN